MNMRTYLGGFLSISFSMARISSISTNLLLPPVMAAISSSGFLAPGAHSQSCKSSSSSFLGLDNIHTLEFVVGIAVRHKINDIGFGVHVKGPIRQLSHTVPKVRSIINRLDKLLLVGWRNGKPFGTLGFVSIHWFPSDITVVPLPFLMQSLGVLGHPSRTGEKDDGHGTDRGSLSMALLSSDLMTLSVLMDAE